MRSAKFGDNAEPAAFATTLDKVCNDTVEAGFMTKDLACLVGPDQTWLSTTGVLAKIAQNLNAAMAAKQAYEPVGGIGLPTSSSRT